MFIVTISLSYFVFVFLMQHQESRSSLHRWWIRSWCCGPYRWGAKSWLVKQIRSSNCKCKAL